MPVDFCALFFILSREASGLRSAKMTASGSHAHSKPRRRAMLFISFIGERFGSLFRLTPVRVFIYYIPKAFQKIICVGKAAFSGFYVIGSTAAGGQNRIPVAYHDRGFVFFIEFFGSRILEHKLGELEDRINFLSFTKRLAMRLKNMDIRPDRQSPSGWKPGARWSSSGFTI